MKLLIDAFKSARKTEIILVVVAACVLLCCLSGRISRENVETDEERRLQHILSQVDGAGKVHVMLSLDNEGERQGAIIVASGAERIEVRLKLQQALHTLTGLELDRIEVVNSKR